MPSVTTNDGVRLNYTDEGTGPPVVLIGGGGMSASAWKLQQDALGSDHRVVSIDRRGHGLSDDVAFGSRMARHGKDIHDALEALDVSDACLVGASMGVSVIWAYADLFGTERVRSIVAIDQTPKMLNDDEWKLGMYNLNSETLDEFVKTFPAGFNPFHTVPRSEVLQLMMAPSNFSIESFRGVLRDHSQQDWREVLPLVDVPVLAIAGRHSPFWPWESSEYIAEHVQKGELFVSEESGHAVFLEDPDGVNDAITRFLR